MSRYTALAGRIRTNLHDIQNTIDRACMLSENAIRTGDDGYWDGVALNLHSYYTGVEHIFEDIGRTLESNLPSGSDWHRDLLIQMSSEIENVRPAVISQASRDCLDEFRGFRHVVRNVYAFNLKPVRLNELVNNLRPCFQVLLSDLGGFADFLDNID